MIVLLATGAPGLAGQITSITSTLSSGLYHLDTVTVSGGAGGSATYSLSQLTGIDVTAYRCTNTTTASLAVASGAAAPAIGSRAALLDGDAYLNTGVINLASADNSLVVHFQGPVTNATGPDIVYFDLGSTDQLSVTMVGGSQTKAFAATDTDWTSLLTNVPFGYWALNGGALTLTDLENNSTTSTGSGTATGGVFGLAIDLSDLGVADGAVLNDLSLSFKSTSSADPMFIAALPVPEPGAVVLLATALLGLLGFVCRRR